MKITAHAKKMIEENPMSLATVGAGKPNVIVVACVKVVSKNQILITDNFMKQTKKNIAKNPNVCIAVWDKNWKGYKINGKARYFSSGKWKEFVQGMKESKSMPAKGAILVTVSKIVKLG